MSAEKIRVRMNGGEWFDVHFQDGVPREVDQVKTVWSTERPATSRELAEKVRQAIFQATGRLAMMGKDARSLELERSIAQSLETKH